jgi:hypothetical protein
MKSSHFWMNWKLLSIFEYIFGKMCFFQEKSFEKGENSIKNGSFLLKPSQVSTDPAY